MSEIQRYETFGGEILEKDNDGAAVLYADHLRAVMRAKIEVLETAANEACPRCRDNRESNRLLFLYGEEEHHMSDDGFKIECLSAPIRLMIAALRKEIGDE